MTPYKLSHLVLSDQVSRIGISVIKHRWIEFVFKIITRSGDWNTDSWIIKWAGENSNTCLIKYFQLWVDNWEYIGHTISCHDLSLMSLQIRSAPSGRWVVLHLMCDGCPKPSIFSEASAEGREFSQRVCWHECGYEQSLSSKDRTNSDHIIFW